MVALQTLELLLILAAVIFAIRRARPATSPFGRRMAWIGFLLAGQIAVLYGFIALQMNAAWDGTSVPPPGVVFLVQALRFALLCAAASAWFGLVRPELRHGWQLVALAIPAIALGWGGGSLPFLAALTLAIGFSRMKWIEDVSGWRRGAGLVLSALLFAAFSIVPLLTRPNGSGPIELTPTARVWPPPLLLGALPPGVANELALIRPLSRAVRALSDLMHVQLLIVMIKLLLLPIRLAGMSLKRRFTFNYVLVRLIPSFLTGLIFAGVAYLALGYHRLDAARAEFEHTLARAGTVAAALAEESAARGEPDPARLAAATRWMGEDGAEAHVVVNDRGPAPAPLPSDTTLAGGRPAPADDSTFTRGLVVTADSLFLVARHAAPGGPAVAVYVPLDSLYIARIMRPIGGELTVSARPHVFVGSTGIRVSRDTSWARHTVTVRASESTDLARRERRYFLARTYVPVGDWSRSLGGTGKVAAELHLATTAGGFARSLLATGRGLLANLPTLIIVLAIVWLFSTLEGLAVRSGRSIVQSVVDEAAALRSAAERFGAGDLDHRLPVRGKDEFSVVAASFNAMAANLKRQREELVVAERFEEDLAVARAIQQRFLPQRLPGLAGLDVAGVSLPSREVGGDLYYWFTHEDGSLGFTLGDVSGKSVPAALLMSNVLAALRAQALARVGLAESLVRVNQFLIEQIEPGRFVTLFYGEADPASGELRYVSAGHNPALLLRADGSVEWLREGGVPLGVVADATYAETGVRFGPGDTLIVYSDGVTEAEGPSTGSREGGDVTRPMFDEVRLAGVARSHLGEPARAVLDAVLEAVHAFAAGVPQADDITVVVVRRA